LILRAEVDGRLRPAVLKSTVIFFQPRVFCSGFGTSLRAWSVDERKRPKVALLRRLTVLLRAPVAAANARIASGLDFVINGNAATPFNSSKVTTNPPPDVDRVLR
jgi:hypothetical protein